MMAADRQRQQERAGHLPLQRRVTQSDRQRDGADDAAEHDRCGDQHRVPNDAALDLEPQARAAFLERECCANVELLHEVESLLNSSEKTVDFARRAVLRVARQQANEQHPTGKLVGDYRLLRVLGEGGMGTVYLATRADEAYQQEVAIKLMHPGFGPSQSMLLRFSAERQILANLNHPNIARLLDGGMTAEGSPYLVMEYVNGTAIDLFCSERQLALDDRLRLFRTLCTAVDYAHRHLVVHRDIKPTNVLVNADGEPKLLDFGIAKLIGSYQTGADPAVTRHSQRLLTPDYASPEQVTGGGISTATDIYSLGAVLYQLLTRKPPHEFADRRRTARGGPVR